MSKGKSAGTGSPRAASKPTSAQQRLAAERAAAARGRIAAAQRRRQWIIAGSATLAVVLVAVVLVVVKIAGVGGPKSGVTATSASAGVVGKVTSVSSATLDTVGAGTISNPPIAISGNALTSNGKPEVFYAGAEYCPYCAAERWAVTVALSRFGTFHDLGQTASSPNDVYPSTPTLSFHGASYTSDTLVFVGKEMNSNKVVDGSYATLDKLTAAEQALVSKYDAPPYVAKDAAGSIPFVDIGGKYMISGASYDPQVLQGKTHQQVADALDDPSSPIAKSVDGVANVITAAICKTTGNQPANVCTSTGVTTAADRLPAAK